MIYTCVPPLPEQAAIVRYFDHVDERIRRYVSGKQKLIRLLEEEKQAVIHRAVTPGPRSQRPPQALRRRVAGRYPGALGGYSCKKTLRHSAWENATK